MGVTNIAMKYQKGDVKLGCFIEPLVLNGYLQFLQQIGTQYCYTWLKDDQLSLEFISDLKVRTARYGISLYNVGNISLGKSASISFGFGRS